MIRPKIDNIVNHLAVRLVNFSLVEVDVYVGDSNSAMAERSGDGILGNVEAGGDGRPCVSSPI